MANALRINLGGKPKPEIKSERTSHRRRGRLVLYTLILLVGLVVAAYIDGGEEPIHPIEQAVDLPQRDTKKQ
ncbi:MAG: hypothetical protein AAF494_00995 [Pseudomonadota bacterium]